MKLNRMMIVLIPMMLLSCNDNNAQTSSSSAASSSAPVAAITPGSSDVVAKVAGQTITYGEVASGIESDLYEAEMRVYQLKFSKLNQIMIEKLINADPKSKGLTKDQYFSKYISSGVKVTDEELKNFITEKKIPESQLNAEVKKKIEQYLTMQKREKAVKDWMAAKSKSAGVEIFLKKPARPVFNVSVGNAPTFGGSSAKVTIVEYSDFQCPFCAQGAKILSQLKQKYGNKIQIAFKQFPLPFHSQAKLAAVASMCIHEQKQELFWQMHDAMFAGQDKLQPQDLKDLAKKLGADSGKFDKCLDEKKYMAHVEKDIQEGKKIGVKSTPTFFINGQLVAGALPVEQFSEIIDEELAK